MRSSGWRISETDYPAIRRVMGPERMTLDDTALERVVGELFPDSDPEDVENFMNVVQRFGREIAPIAQRALPGVAQGAVQGATVAGPWGALAGAIGGGAASLLSRPQPSGPAPAVPGLAAAPQLAGVGGAPGAPNAAAAQLMTLLARPETLQALLALLMSTSGRPAVQVGSQTVPPAAFANAVAETAAAILEDAGFAPRAAVAEYLVDHEGSPRCDLANPRARAALLIGDIATVIEAESAEADPGMGEDRGSPESHALDEWDESDPLDGYESARSGLGGI